MISQLKFAQVLAFIGVMTLMVPATVSGQAQTSQPQTIGGVTQPVRTQQARLTIEWGGVVKSINIKPGDRVKKDQLLVQLDDSLEMVKLRSAEAEASSTARIEEAHANLEVKKSARDRKEKMQKDKVISESEIEEARLEVIDAEARLKVAELDRLKTQFEAEGQRVKIARMKLVSPFDGVVEAVDASVGEVIDPTAKDHPILTLVQNNPLCVEIRNMPTAWAGKLKVGDKLEVRYDDRYAGTPIYDQQWVPSDVIFKAPVADAQSDTQLVRLAMPNARSLDAGLQVVVKLPESVTNPAASPSAAARP